MHCVLHTVVGRMSQHDQEHANSSHPHHNPRRGYVIIPILRRRKLRHRKITELASGNQNLTLSRLTLESIL